VGVQEHIPGLQAVSADVIYPHIFPNADREVGGVLVGRIPSDGSLPTISGAIPAISADEQRATLTFTQDAWEHVHRVLDTEFPQGDQIVGWYHSHPGFGIFLSGHDLFIHENFFGGPSQIAVVVDPHERTEGAFVWRAGKIEKMFEQPTPEGWRAEVPRRQVLIAADPIEATGIGGWLARNGLGEGAKGYLNLAAYAAIGALAGLGVLGLRDLLSSPTPGAAAPIVTRNAKITTTDTVSEMVQPQPRHIVATMPGQTGYQHSQTLDAEKRRIVEMRRSKSTTGLPEAASKTDGTPVATKPPVEDGGEHPK